MKKSMTIEMQAKNYMESYRQQISERFQQYKKQKEMMQMLEMDPQEQQEMEKRMQEDLVKFTKTLQEDEEYKKFIKLFEVK